MCVRYLFIHVMKLQPKWWCGEADMKTCDLWKHDCVKLCVWLWGKVSRGWNPSSDLTFPTLLMSSSFRGGNLTLMVTTSVTNIVYAVWGCVSGLWKPGQSPCQPALLEGSADCNENKKSPEELFNQTLVNKRTVCVLLCACTEVKLILVWRSVCQWYIQSNPSQALCFLCMISCAYGLVCACYVWLSVTRQKYIHAYSMTVCMTVINEALLSNAHMMAIKETARGNETREHYVWWWTRKMGIQIYQQWTLSNLLRKA